MNSLLNIRLTNLLTLQDRILAVGREVPEHILNQIAMLREEQKSLEEIYDQEQRLDEKENRFG